MLSVIWAFGPPIDMKVAALGPIENKWFTRDFRGSVAKHLLFLLENKQKQIPRFAPFDSAQGR
jgi:hypothetical protein